jgi:hypothetical protein
MIPSTSISFGFKGRAKFVEVSIRASDVPIKYLDSFEVKIRETLRKSLECGLDMKCLHSIIDRSELSVRTHSELSTAPHERFLVETWP